MCTFIQECGDPKKCGKVIWNAESMSLGQAAESRGRRRRTTMRETKQIMMMIELFYFLCFSFCSLYVLLFYMVCDWFALQQNWRDNLINRLIANKVLFLQSCVNKNKNYSANKITSTVIQISKYISYLKKFAKYKIMYFLNSIFL